MQQSVKDTKMTQMLSNRIYTDKGLYWPHPHAESINNNISLTQIKSKMKTFRISRAVKSNPLMI